MANRWVVEALFFHNLNGDYPFQVVHDTVREFCEAQDIAVLDLRTVYSEFSGPELWVHETDQHPNELAHAMAARAVVEHMLRTPSEFGLAH